MMQTAWESGSIKGSYPSTAIQQPETVPTVERIYEAFSQCDDLARMIMDLAQDVCGPAPEGKCGGLEPSPAGIANQLEARARNSKMLASDAFAALRRIQGVFK